MTLLGLGIGFRGCDADDLGRARGNLRNKCLSFAKTCSIGFMSGEYSAGRRLKHHAASQIAVRADEIAE
jgi:hypothetical protein